MNWVYSVTVQVFGAVGLLFVLHLPAFAARGAFALLNMLLGGDFAALGGFLRLDNEHFIADVDAIGHGFFMAVFANNILTEEAVSALIGCGG